MIYNENGKILNEEYCLLEYINNNSYLDDLLNENNIWKTIKDK